MKSVEDLQLLIALVLEKNSSCLDEEIKSFKDANEDVTEIACKTTIDIRRESIMYSLGLGKFIEEQKPTTATVIEYLDKSIAVFETMKKIYADCKSDEPLFFTIREDVMGRVIRDYSIYKDYLVNGIN